MHLSLSPHTVSFSISYLSLLIDSKHLFYFTETLSFDRLIHIKKYWNIECGNQDWKMINTEDYYTENPEWAVVNKIQNTQDQELTDKRCSHVQLCSIYLAWWPVQISELYVAFAWKIGPFRPISNSPNTDKPVRGESPFQTCFSAPIGWQSANLSWSTHWAHETQIKL